MPKLTAEQKEAMRRFLSDGLWSDPGRLDQFRSMMHAIWDDFKDDPRYDELRRQLSEAMKKRGS